MKMRRQGWAIQVFIPVCTENPEQVIGYMQKPTHGKRSLQRVTWVFKGVETYAHAGIYVGGF